MAGLETQARAKSFDFQELWCIWETEAQKWGHPQRGEALGGTRASWERRHPATPPTPSLPTGPGFLIRSAKRKRRSKAPSPEQREGCPSLCGCVQGGGSKIPHTPNPCAEDFLRQAPWPTTNKIPIKNSECFFPVGQGLWESVGVSVKREKQNSSVLLLILCAEASGLHDLKRILTRTLHAGPYESLERTEVRRGEVTCARSHGQGVENWTGPPG